MASFRATPPHESDVLWPSSEGTFASICTIQVIARVPTYQWPVPNRTRILSFKIPVNIAHVWGKAEVRGDSSQVKVLCPLGGYMREKGRGRPPFLSPPPSCRHDVATAPAVFLQPRFASRPSRWQIQVKVSFTTGGGRGGRQADVASGVFIHRR